MEKKIVKKVLAMVLFFSFIFVGTLYSADWSGVPDWNPGDGRDVINNISIIEYGRNLVVAGTEESLGNYYPDVALYTIDDDGNKLSGPFLYGSFWSAYAEKGFAEYDDDSGKYIFNVVGKECVSYDICQATFFRVYEDGTYVQNGQGENWHHFFNPEGEEFIDAMSTYYSGCKLSNGNYIAVGSIQMPNAVNTSYNAFAVCFSPEEEILWYRILDGSEIGQVFSDIDKIVDCVEHNGFVYVLIDTESEGPGSDFDHHNYKIAKINIMDGSYSGGQIFGEYCDDYPKKIFVYNNFFLVYGYTEYSGPRDKVFVDKISFDLVQETGFPLIIDGDYSAVNVNDLYRPVDAVVNGEILHTIGSVRVDDEAKYRLFHMGINLESRQLEYLDFVGMGEDIKCGGSSVIITVEGNILAGGFINEIVNSVYSDADYFLSFLDLNSQTQTQEITLNAGWNLISFYVQPEDNAIDSVLSAILSDCEKVWTIEGGVWKLYDPDDPFFSDLSEMKAGQGYMIKMSSSVVLSVSGPVLDEAISLNAGWEMPGYLSELGYSPEDALASIAGKFEKVWTIEGGVWKLYDPDDLFFSDLSEMKAGQGYMIKINENCSWMLP